MGNILYITNRALPSAYFKGCLHPLIIEAKFWDCLKWSKTLKLQKGYIIFTSPIGGANKKVDALKNLHRFPYSLRHRLSIKL